MRLPGRGAGSSWLGTRPDVCRPAALPVAGHHGTLVQAQHTGNQSKAEEGPQDSVPLTPDATGALSGDSRESCLLLLSWEQETGPPGFALHSQGSIARTLVSSGARGRDPEESQTRREDARAPGESRPGPCRPYGNPTTQSWETVTLGSEHSPRHPTLLQHGAVSPGPPVLPGRLQPGRALGGHLGADRLLSRAGSVVNPETMTSLNAGHSLNHPSPQGRAPCWSK